jgi:hypothetical protein
MICPNCRSPQVRRIRRDGFKAILRSLMGWWPYLCEACGNRFSLKARRKR